MDIKINYTTYQVNPDEYNETIKVGYENLKILDKLGEHERAIGLLKDLSVFAKQCFFFSQSHGGFIGISVASSYDNIYFLNNQESHIENIRTNVIRKNIENVLWEFDINKNGITVNDPIVLYSDNYDNIDETFLNQYNCIILTGKSEKLLKTGLYQNIYELTDSHLALYIPYALDEEFKRKFYYYLNNEKFFYDNLIHLCIMVKNGGAQFEDMLKKNMGLIDRWTILDTGSTDETIDIINRTLVGVKRGELFQEPFINFRDSRNRLLNIAGTACKYTLMIDDTYIIEGDLRSFLKEIRGDQFGDSYSLYIKSDDVEYATNRIVKTEKKLRYLLYYC